MTILEEANELIYGERKEQYGDAGEIFTRIGKAWEAILGIPVSAEQVGLCMAGMKLVRATQRQDPDDLRDAAGYVGCVEQVRRRPPQDRVPVPEVEDDATSGYGTRVVLEAEPVGGEAEAKCRCPGVGLASTYCPIHGAYTG